MKQQSELLKSAKLILRDPLGLLGLVIVIALVGSAIFAPSLAPFNPTAIDMKARLSGPTASHWLGTDQLGRDTFSRMILGGRVALQVALPSIAAALGLGLLLGMVAGYGPRWLDNAIMLLFDTLRSFPTVMLALSFVALVGPSLGTVMLVVIVTSAPIYGRIARTQTMTLKSSEFITAEEAMGARMPRILLIHILPNILGTLVVLASMDIPAVIALEAGLSFLGMGVKPPTPSWGSLLKDGYALIRSTPWLIIAGALPIVMTTLGFTFLGEALRDVADPKLRRTR
ncbi:ABC transporter permease [Pseudaminobacter soli (ex Li et al. 2025)]|uniref:Peptide ABC transporter permease n=1 Tax=Pseudaminobacter soli (ex Li et al. 2025) TaxID=1295366 RepID=A0A2P7SL81_9HYPH|nr:ABC transporter permease [Mesorhizobium soli]PSJ63197.1 peptide ABC transporter permease [Mesorhizobium soli]